MAGEGYSTDEARQAKELYLTGDTFSEMAKKMGRTRCSVIGYCSRMVKKGEFPVRDNAALNAQQIRRRRERRIAEKAELRKAMEAQRNEDKSRRPLQNAKALEASLDSPNKVVVEGKKVSMFMVMINEKTPPLHELKGCAFPHDGKWCNKEKPQGSYYCEEHQKIVYNRKAANEQILKKIQTR